MRRILAIFCLCACIVSCNEFQATKSDEKPLARVKDVYLFPSDFGWNTVDLNQNKLSDLQRAKIRNWVMNQLILRENTLDQEDLQAKFSRKIESYARSLQQHEFEKKVIKYETDTSITNEQVLEFYTSEFANSRSIEDQFLVFSLSPVENEMNINTAQPLLAGFGGTDARQILSDSSLHEVFAQIKPLGWFNSQDVGNAAQIPIPTDIEKGGIFFNGNQIIWIQNQVKAGEIQPLELLETDIKRSILKSREDIAIRNAYERLFNDAVSSNTAEIYP